MLLTARDNLLALIQAPEGETQSREKTDKRLVIVDDNPVILSLYTRLFKRAGFNPITAKNGREGVEIIKKERPLAAVIDFMLPVLSGIDVCRLVRQDPLCSHTRLILFTSDNQPETRQRALEAGANEVIIKSPEASEVVETVVKLIGYNQESRQE
ncbi:MAG TPA: response regulator [Desulfobacterales bacterium]|nr:response regulator [Desulfobacterales bacterium]